METEYKVVCIDDSNQDSGHTVIGAERIKKNEIYTVIGTSYIGGFILKEVYCGIYMGSGTTGGFKPSRFRKLDYEFSENLLAEIKEAVQSEYQLN